MINNYQVLGCLYSNGCNKVHICINKKNGLKYVMKYINIPKKDSKRQMRQVQLYTKFRHQNLIYMQEYFYHEEQNLKYLNVVMQYCSEGNLNDKVVGNSCYDFVDLVIFMLDIAKGVMFLHQNNVIHRDIKAENILLLRKKIKISDFGVSKIMNKDSNHRSINMTRRVGTQTYMAPEMLDQKQKNYGFQVDIWAMGILFLELMIGSRIGEIINEQFPQKQSDFPNQKLKNRIASRVLRKIIQNMVNRDRQNRWKIQQVVNQLSIFLKTIQKNIKTLPAKIQLPLIEDDLNLSDKFTKEYRIDLGKKHLKKQSIKQRTFQNYEIQIIYDDYEQSLVFKAWGYQIKYTYNMIPPEIRQKFSNLQDLYRQFQKQSQNIQIQTTGFMQVNLFYRQKQPLLNYQQKIQAFSPKFTIEQSIIEPQTQKRQQIQQHQNDSNNQYEQSQLVEISHRQKQKLHCQYIQLIKSFNFVNISKMQPSSQQNKTEISQEIENLIKKQLQKLQSSQKKSSDELISLYTQKGFVQIEKGQYQEAIYFLKLVKDDLQAKKSKNQNYVVIVQTIGELYLRCEMVNYGQKKSAEVRVKMLQQSLKCFNEALQIRRRLPSNNSVVGQCRIQNFIGIIYFYLQEYIKAKRHFQQSLRIIQSRKGLGKEYKAVVCNNIANIHNVLKQDNPAISYYSQALNCYFQEKGLNYSNYSKDMMNCCQSLCAVYFSHKNYMAGTDILEKILNIMSMDGSIKQQKMIQYIRQCFCEWFAPALQNSNKPKTKISLYAQQRLFDIFQVYFPKEQFFIQKCFEFQTYQN